MDVRTTIVHSLRSSQALLHRYAGDLKPDELLHRTTPKANCTAWVIGHLALSDRRALAALGVKDLPVLPEAFEARFGKEGAAALDCGDTSGLLATFDAQRNRLIQAVEQASDEQLDGPIERPTPLFRTAGEVANFMGLHTAMHAGQITLIRRSLGYPPIV